MTHDGCCEKLQCFGEPLLEDNSAKSGSNLPVPIARPVAGTVEGLCVLVCDVSGSMDEPAFANHPAEKLRLVTGAIHKAIAELQTLSKADAAYIGIVAFGARAGLIQDPVGQPFLKSVAQIIDEFGEYAGNLPTYLYDYFREDRGGFGRDRTDITAGLRVAREIYDHTLKGDLNPLGVNASAKLMEHSDIVTQAGTQITMPNIRVMIYSDGGHNPADGSALINAFQNLAPSPLMTAFIGDEHAGAGSVAGANEMRSLANDCPEHGQKGYFLINSPERYAVLRSLFRMASGASGFCPQCLRRQVGAFELPQA